MASTWVRLGAAVALLVAGLVAALFAWVYARQEQLLFHPEPLSADHRFPQVDGVHETTVQVEGASLSALHLRLPSPKGVVFYLHGNAGNLQSWFVNADFYRRANYDLFMVDYRGYGKSSGRIESEAQLRADVRAAWDSIAPRYQGLRRVVFGRSLGTALAAGLAAEVAPDLTVLVSPYCSMQSLAAEHYPLLPGALLRYPLRTCDDAVRLQGSLLLLHGERDDVVPVHHSVALKAAVPRASLVRIAQAGHGDVHEFAAYLDALRDALDAL